MLITAQTTAAGFAWYSILRYAYPGQVRWVQVYACYATAVALNFVLPANLGTLVMLLMFTTIIAAATFAGVVAGYVVQKMFFTAIGTAIYLYLFLSVGGSFSLQFGFIEEHPWAFVILLAAVAVLLFLVFQTLRPRIAGWWEDAKDGGQILARPRSYLLLVLAPEAVSWLAMLGTIAVFLAAYNIPVTFHTLMSVVGGNSIANMTSVTPGRRGRRAELQRALAQERHEREQRDRLLGRAAARRDRLEHRARDHPARAGVRLDRRPRARRAVLHPGEAEGRRRVRGTARAEGGQARRAQGTRCRQPSAPDAQTHRQRYALLLAAIIVVFWIEGISQPSSAEQVLVSALLGVTLLLALWAAEARRAVMLGRDSGGPRRARGEHR